MTVYVVGAGGSDLPAAINTISGSFTTNGSSLHGNAGGASSYGTLEDLGVGASCTVRINPRGGGQYIGPAVRGSNSAFTCANVDAGADGLYVSTWAAGTQDNFAGPLTCPAVDTDITLIPNGNDLELEFDGVNQDTYVGELTGMTGTYVGVTAYANGTTTGTTRIETTAAGGGDPASTEYSQELGRRNRPGRGPYSVGRFFVSRIDAFPLGPLVYEAAVAESGSASDSFSALVVHASNVTESASASDVVAAALNALAATTESAAAADDVSAALSALGAVAEVADALDALSAALEAVAASSEAGAAADVVDSVATLIAALAETGNPSDSISGDGAVYSVTVEETAAASDAQSAALTAVGACSESASAADTVAALATLSAALAESGEAIDTLSALGEFGVVIVEAGNAADLITALSDVVTIPGSRTIVLRARNRLIAVRTTH